MPRDLVSPPKSLDEILDWLHPDRDQAGDIYVQLRHDLTKIFNWNRCADPDGLTDEVFDRVARKVHDVRPTFEGDPKLYFYGVARNLIKESPKRVKRQVSLDDAELRAPDTSTEDETARMREECLDRCLQDLDPEKKELILSYYARDKQAKIDYRSQMARELGITVETLRVRIHRLRGTIETCIQRCLDRIDRKK